MFGLSRLAAQQLPTVVFILMCIAPITNAQDFVARPDSGPTASVDKDQRAFQETQAEAAAVGRWITEVASLRQAIDPSMFQPTPITKLRWQVMQAKLDLLTLPDGDLRLSWDPMGNPGDDADSISAHVGGFFYWQFEAPSFVMNEDRSITAGALYVLWIISSNMPDTHVNVHCIVLSDSSSGANPTKRYVTFDADAAGRLLAPDVSITPPRVSLHRREEIARLFEERAKARSQWKDCSATPGQACDEPERRFKELDSRVPGTIGLRERLRGSLAKRD